MSTQVLRQLRVIGFIEAISFLLLLGVAMPLKYLAGMPRAVSIVGMAHGVLFLLFVAAAAHAAFVVRWPLSRTLMVLGAAVVPAGPFAIDGWLRRQQEAAARQKA